MRDGDSEIKAVDELIKSYKDYVKNNPEKIGVQGNFNLLKQIKEELVAQKKKEDMEEIL